jgi:hypothetical protein
MNKNQRIFFASMFTSFFLTVTIVILSLEGWPRVEREVYVYLIIIYVVVGAFMHWWVHKNPKIIDRLFR